jgi:hypothetical protein
VHRGIINGAGGAAGSLDGATRLPLLWQWRNWPTGRTKADEGTVVPSSPEFEKSILLLAHLVTKQIRDALSYR